MTLREQYEKENRRVKYVDWLEIKLKSQPVSNNCEGYISDNISIFKNAVEDAINFFGLYDYEFVVEKQEKKIARASYYYHNLDDEPDSDARIFTICYSECWIEDKTTTKDDIIKTAWHEVFESMFYRLLDYSLNTQYIVQPREVDSEIHKIVRIFENKILPLINIEKEGGEYEKQIRTIKRI